MKTFLLFLLLPLYLSASVTVTVNGSNYTIPQTNERGWGNAVTSWIQAITQYSLQPSGGSFVLTNDVDFGATYGLKPAYIASRTANASTAGMFRLAKTDFLGWRNNANSANLLLGIDSSNNLTFNGDIIPTASNAVFKDSIFSVVDSSDATKRVLVDVSGTTSTATTLLSSQTANRTLTLPDATDTLVGKNTTDFLQNKTLSYPIVFDAFSIVDQASDPATPAGGYKNLYGKSGGMFYRNSAGTIYQVANLTESQTLTNKTLTVPTITSGTVSGTAISSAAITASALTGSDIDGATASNTSRLVLPKASKATLDGLTRKQAALAYDTTSDKLWYDNGTVLKAVGTGSGSGGGVNLLDNPGFENGVSSSWTSSGGTYAAAAGGNVLYETLSAAFTPSATGQYFESTAVTVPPYLQSQDCVAQIAYKGADANVYMTVMDGSSVELIPTASRATLSAQSTRKIQKIYFTCPASGSVKVRVQSTASGAIGYYDQAKLGETDFMPVSSNVGWTSYTATITGAGTATAVTFWWKRDGDSLSIRGYFTTGTVAAATASISLPSNLVMDSNKFNGSNGMYVGDAFRNVATASVRKRFKLYGISSTPSVLYFVNDDYTTAVSPGSTLNGNAIWANSEGEYVEAVNIPIVGWSATDDSINTKCGSDIACENTFTAQISSTGTVSGENLDFINGNCAVASAVYTCTYSSGIFTSAPNCTVSLSQSTNANQNATVGSNTSSTLTVSTFAGGAASAANWNLTCQKTGSDYKARQNIQGFLQSNLTSSNNNMRFEFASLGTTCSTTPCTLLTQFGSWVTNITRSATGTYSVNIAAGTFSSPPICTTIAGGVVGGMLIKNGSATTTAYILQGSVAGTPTDVSFDIMCAGPR